MGLTINNAAAELRKRSFDSVAAAADCVAGAMLRGARGNSGVILSLLFRGIARRLKGTETAGAEEVAGAGLGNVEAKPLDTLLVEFCRRENARVVIRGVRVYSDFEYESQMALVNRRLAPEVETLFMMPGESLAYVTASTVREIARYGGDTAPFVTETVHRRIVEKLAKGN